MELTVKLNVLIVISNPCLYKRRYQLAKEFIERIRYNLHIELYIVELCYKDQQFVITNSNNKNHLQLRTEIPLWHKENMINLGVKKLLPKDWKKFAFIDADIEFLEEDWVINTIKLLDNGYDIIQLYSKCKNLDINQNNFYTNNSFMYDFLNNNCSYNLKIKNTDWHPGFGWAMNRNIYEKIIGLYDKSILGSGDNIMLFSILKNIKEFINERKCSNSFSDSLLRYQFNIHLDNYKYSIAYLPTTIRHHWHGQLKNRKYLERSKILNKYNYNPDLFLRYDNNGLLIPTEECPKELLDDILNYFKERNEDEFFDKILENNLNEKKDTEINTKIEDKLNIIMVLSNPCLFLRRYQLALQFIERIEKNKDINLYIVEMCYGNQKFIITKSNNNNHLQLRTEIPLWHKENMINLGVKYLLPKEWKAFAWIDADIEFLDYNWVNNTLKLLNKFDIIQLYSECLFLDENENTSITFQSFGKDFSNKKKYVPSKKDSHPGFGWAITRKLWNNINYIYDRSIICNGDLIFILCILNDIDMWLKNKNFIDNKYTDNIINYKNNYIKNKNNNNIKFGYLNCIIKHYFHGQLQNRKYIEGYDIIKNHNFDPNLHLEYDNNGILIPSKECPQKLLDDILEYFLERDEDEYFKLKNIKI